ncbi:unnamed protein product [Lepeophtheirus salmonis]|uniref:(salmon louse) hypothetical protein n=1 Tax=Lepeophtheirus salmonis TaxID=72036 RepID=A0A7R8CKE4_LEPSM|nr:unnamed protein product [Lepeophtheirus salmonis]CAF2846179.1 unnamed protein product [Lepeophtheirus salmonis]
MSEDVKNIPPDSQVSTKVGILGSDRNNSGKATFYLQSKGNKTKSFSIDILALDKALQINSSRNFTMQTLQFRGQTSESELVEALKPFTEEVSAIVYVRSGGKKLSSARSLPLRVSITNWAPDFFYWK